MIHYETYENIPFLLQEYLLTITNFAKIEQISLEDINSFLNGLEEYYKNLKNETTQN